MDKNEIVTKVQELRKTIAEKRIALVKGELKDTSSLSKARKELAALLTKLNTTQYGA